MNTYSKAQQRLAQHRPKSMRDELIIAALMGSLEEVKSYITYKKPCSNTGLRKAGVIVNITNEHIIFKNGDLLEISSVQHIKMV